MSHKSDKTVRVNGFGVLFAAAQCQLRRDDAHSPSMNSHLALCEATFTLATQSQCEFKVGGGNAKGNGMWKGDVTAPSSEICLFCDVEVVYFGVFWGAKVKVCNDIGGMFPLTSPKPKYWRGCVPGNSRRC